MGNKITRIGKIIMLICPLIVLIGVSAWMFMPGCQAGSIGPASGCILLGVNLNWFINLTILAFMGAFLFVPLGLVIWIVGVFLSPKRATLSQEATDKNYSLRALEAESNKKPEK
ncbi:hypothetical protein [Methylophilus sp. 14]|uniref:hypothetical protein n=1 Tax=Methylophilus sp. 14 TaxID=2781019 RepID=UPI00188EBFFF|nr:hypothetical protein [Methylophilus sp. 14]MBF4987808.1 hypothetical protein [Methylophilus sp. 14]